MAQSLFTSIREENQIKEKKAKIEAMMSPTNATANAEEGGEKAEADPPAE
mgnify:CR=1 FL=1